MESMMAKSLSYLPLKANFSILFLIVSFIPGYSQFQILDSIAIKNITHVSSDRLGNIYTGDIKGNIRKYNTSLKELELFSPERKGEISVLDCWNPLRIFISYKDLQEFIFLDRFLINANRFKLDKTPYAGLAGPSIDNNVWYVDFSTFTLKKLDINLNQIVISRPLDLLLNPEDYNLTHLREYQNLLFISDSKSGILVFDNLANFLYKIEANEINYFNFIEDEIYYLEDGNLIRKKLYTSSQTSEKLNRKVDFALITKKEYFFFTKNQLLRAVKP